MQNSIQRKGIPSSIRSLKGKRVQVLCFLACEGPANIYQIAKGASMRYSVAHKSVRDLEKRGFIRLEEEKLGKKGVMTKVYVLTLRGLLMAIKSGELGVDDMDRVTARWKHHLPMLFGNWQYFGKMQLKKEVFEFLKGVDTGYRDERRVLWELAVEAIKTQGLFNFIMWGGSTGFFSEESWKSLVKWLKAIRGNPDLRKWMIDHIKREVNIAKALLRMSEETLQIIESPSEPDWEKLKKWPEISLM
jgi:predicted transcriptional regulator